MSEQILFSIGIPAYKGKYFDECIESILSQSYQDFELIIIDDCSPDSINKIVSKKNDKRIKYFKNKSNIGAENVVDNWNNCLKVANGHFFILMGDDDKFEPEYLEEFLKLIKNYPGLDVYHCRSKIIDEDSVPIQLTPSCPEYETVYENMWHRLNFLRHQFISDFVFRTSKLKENGGFFKLPLAWGSDDISAYIAIGNKGIAHTNKPLLNYRVNRYNITSTGNEVLKMRAILGVGNWINNFLNNVPQSDNDKLLHSLIKNSIQKSITKSKRSLIRPLLRKNFVVSISKWWFNRKEFSLSTRDLLAAVIGKI